MIIRVRNKHILEIDDFQFRSSNEKLRVRDRCGRGKSDLDRCVLGCFLNEEAFER